MIERLDTFAEERGYTRSEALRKIIQDALNSAKPRKAK